MQRVERCAASALQRECNGPRPVAPGSLGLPTPVCSSTFVISRPAMTCLIPGTGRPKHMFDNAAAGARSFPSPVDWRDQLTSIGA